MYGRLQAGCTNTMCDYYFSSILRHSVGCAFKLTGMEYLCASMH